MLPLLYLLFFLSGAAALIYEVAWARSLALVFGGSHLAVTVVLAVFMGGLALGSWLIGRRVDRAADPLRLYACLELGIAVFAGVFLLLMRLYPSIYVPLARGHDDHRVYLAVLRAGLATIAMIVPTTMMGGTLPVLTRLIATRTERLGRRISFLYGFNTLGAVAGTLLAGLVLLRTLGVERTQLVAIAINVAVGLAALVLAPRSRGLFASASPAEPVPAPPPPRSAWLEPVLWGIGISGFCALGYEVLWTRVLTMVVGTSVYSFAVMLAAFLTGIAVGSWLFGWLLRRRAASEAQAAGSLAVFGAVQVVIGAVALLTSWSLRDLPAQAIRFQNLLLRTEVSEFEVRQGANFLLAFSLMFVPAIFMGVAFPLAARIQARRRGAVGTAVGEVAAFNTVGAILGAGSSGFVLVYLFGVERALQLLSLLNIGTGLWVAAGARRGRAPRWAAAGATIVCAGLLISTPELARMWDRKYFAVYRNNQRSAFSTPRKIREALKHTDVLYYHEGINETISVIRPKGGEQGLLVNGRVEASSTRWDMQCQRTLGHLPMLLCERPRNVFVLGLGTGMTLGATARHPEVESLTLAEIELGVIPAARQFGLYNGNVLDRPGLRIVHNDGRNFLLTTDQRFDVVTADPIHPWSGGAAYLYTTEYYRSVARRLAPGGVACQWLPIYELTVRDLQTVVRTWMENFRYGMLWLTYYDAELVGSNDPLLIDPERLDQRIAFPEIARDLAEVEMGSGRDFLGYFVMGSEGLRAFARGGVINTDDNLWLEFSAPESVGKTWLMGGNVLALGEHRESIVPYLVPGVAAEVVEELQRDHAAGRIYDQAHALFLRGERRGEELAALLEELERLHPDYAPARFLRDELAEDEARRPRLYRAVTFELETQEGQRKPFELSAVTIRISPSRGVVVFVDNAVREIYGQRYIDAPEDEVRPRLREIAEVVLEEIELTYRLELQAARGRGAALPAEGPTLDRLRELVARRCAEPEP